MDAEIRDKQVTLHRTCFLHHFNKKKLKKFNEIFMKMDL